MNQLDFGFGVIEAEFWRLLFVMTRTGAAMVAAPFFGAGTVPAQVRVIAAGALAVLICAWTPVQAPDALFSVQGMLWVAGEVLIGLMLGFTLQIAFAAPVLAAEVIGGSMGMSMATAVDPNSGAQSPALGQYFTVVITLIFLSLGAHLQWMNLLVESYRVFPPGQTWLSPDKIAGIAAFATTMFTTAVAIALPVCLILLMVQIVTGVLSRSAPALNLFALGLPAGVLAGIAALIISAPVLTEQLIDLTATTLLKTEGLLVR
ncbi:MAG: flagellar biosynthetic protein FliR [Sphingomonadaceae bacterium]|nr:flagellar biosynthetic protein FliR [Sphingomonadaceae bacterium]